MGKQVGCDNNGSDTANKLHARHTVSVKQVSAGINTFDWSDSFESHSGKIECDNKPHWSKTSMRCV